MTQCPKREEDNYRMLAVQGVIPLLTDELVKRGKGLIREGHSPRLIKKVFETVCLDMVKKKIEDSAISMKDCDMKVLLSKFLATQLPKKLFGSCPEYIANIIVGAIHATGYDYDDIGPFEECMSDFEDGFNLIGINMVSGGSVGDSFFLEGIAFKSTALRGSEEHEVVQNPKILLFNRDAGNVIDILDKCEKHCRIIVLSSQAIDGGAKKKLAKRGIYFGELVAKKYLDHVAAATGADYVPSIRSSTLNNSHIGTCERFQQIQFGNELFGVCSGCPRGKTATIVLRGDDQLIEAEMYMYVYGLIPYVRSLMKDRTLVAGGRSLYNNIVRYLSEEANNVDKDSKPIVKAFSKAIKTLSKETCDNVGDNAVNNPSQKDAAGLGEGDTVWEPPSLKIDIICLATAFACMKMNLPSKGTCIKTGKRSSQAIGHFHAPFAYTSAILLCNENPAIIICLGEIWLLSGLCLHHVSNHIDVNLPSPTLDQQ